MARNTCWARSAPGSRSILGIGYWPALILAPSRGAVGMVLERLFLRHVYQARPSLRAAAHLRPGADHRGRVPPVLRLSGQPYSVPAQLTAATNLGFMFLPNYRAWVIVASLAVCFGTWFLIERTRLGAYLRAATENPTLVRPSASTCRAW